MLVKADQPLGQMLHRQFGIAPRSRQLCPSQIASQLCDQNLSPRRSRPPYQYVLGGSEILCPYKGTRR